jgi:uncharacterized protein (TIGR03435 family)
MRPIRRSVAIGNCLALAFLSFPLVVAHAQQPSGAVAASERTPSFEVASVKTSRPDDDRHSVDGDSDRVTIENYTLRDLIALAYSLKSDSQVVGGPDWLDKKHFDIAAKVDDTELAKLKTMRGNDFRNEWNQMMQSLLADRFALKVKQGQRIIPVLALVITKSGQKLTLANAKEPNSLSARNSHLSATSASMADLADFLTGQVETEGRVVVDRTGLTGNFDFKLDWTRDRGNGIPPDAQFPGLFTALRDQVGLQLKPDKAAVDVVIVESSKEPAAD